MFLFKLNYSLLFWLSRFTFSRILIMHCLCVLCYLPYFVCTCKFIMAGKVLKHVLALSMVVNLYGIQAWTYE
jgi:endonuclease/exonuclease/phosphatase (EEP) superfamily protein YafD